MCINRYILNSTVVLLAKLQCSKSEILILNEHSKSLLSHYQYWQLINIFKISLRNINHTTHVALPIGL